MLNCIRQYIRNSFGNLRKCLSIWVVTFSSIFINTYFCYADSDSEKSNASLAVVLYDSISYDSYNLDTFHHTQKGLESGFRKEGYDNPIEIYRFGSDLKEAPTHITLYFYEYTYRRVRIAAFYVKSGKRHKLGYFTQTLDTDLPPDQSPTWLIEQLTTQLIKRLRKQFPDDFTPDSPIESAS